MSARLPHQAVADEVRSVMARKRISGVKLAEKIGWNQRKMGRRLSGAVPLDINDLSEIAAALNVPITDFLPVKLPRADSNSQPAGYPESPAYVSAA